MNSAGKTKKKISTFHRVGKKPSSDTEKEDQT